MLHTLSPYYEKLMSYKHSINTNRVVLKSLAVSFIKSLLIWAVYILKYGIIYLCF